MPPGLPFPIDFSAVADGVQSNVPSEQIESNPIISRAQPVGPRLDTRQFSHLMKTPLFERLERPQDRALGSGIQAVEVLLKGFGGNDLVMRSRQRG